MNIYQVIMIVLWSMSLGISLAKHGKLKEGKVSFWTSLTAVIIEWFLLVKGGFF